MKKRNLLPISLIGLAWTMFGMGYQAIVIHYLPVGLAFLAESIGLLLAGAVTGALLITALDSMDSAVGRILVVMGYIMFAPVGMMAGLVAPGQFEPMGGESWLVFSLVTPVLITLIASISVGIGLGFTGGLALAAQRLRRHS